MANRLKLFRFAAFVLAGLFAAAFAGCDQANDPNDENLATEDAAESIAAAVGEAGGGVLDQLGDLAVLSSQGGVGTFSLNSLGGQELMKGVSTADTAIYDAGTGYWTINISRQWSAYMGLYSASFTRVYQVQFRKQNGVFQQFYIVGPDTAYSINFKIISGTGYARSPRWQHMLGSLSADLLATGTNTSTITVNGTYSRSAIDTLLTRNGMRTMNNSLELNLQNVTGPRGTRTNVSTATAGTITGTYTATVTFLSGETYAERNITRNFTITFNNGTVTISVEGTIFRCDPGTGVIVSG